MKKRIYLSPPHAGQQEKEALLRAFESGWIAPVGPELDSFEAELAAYFQVPYAVALSSGTAAMHLAMRLLDVQQGDHIYCSSLTFVGSVSSLVHEGAKPVFIDSESQSWNIDPQLVREAFQVAREREQLPKALVVVDIYGMPANYSELIPLCQEYGVELIEDAAEAAGAEYDGKRAGSFGRFGILSFNGNKIFTSSGGGALLCHNHEDAEKARFLATQARESVAHYEHKELGYNYRMSNLLAAFGRVQLARLTEFMERKNEIFDRYRDGFKEFSEVSFQESSTATSVSNRWLSCILLSPDLVRNLTPEMLRVALEEQDIESRPFWKPMHRQPVFHEAATVGGEVSESLFERGLCLPSGISLTVEQQNIVIETLKKLIGQ